MTFLSELTLGQWLAALAVPTGIVALYFLRLRRRPLEVPSTLLWKKSIEDLRVNALWQRLRQNLLLLLQLIICALVLGALLRPAWNVSTTGKRIILLLDQSASMSATDVQPTRLASAKENARRIIDQMGPGDAGMVIAFADSARVVAAYTEDRAALHRAVASIEQTDRPTDIGAALTIASGLANPQRTLEDPTDAEIVPEDPLATAGIPATMYVLSDGGFSRVQDFDLGNLTLEFVRVGENPPNVAVLALSAREKEGRAEENEIFGRVKNYSKDAVSVEAELRVDDETVDLRRLDIPAGEEVGVTFPGPTARSFRASLHLTVGDGLAVDDVAYLSVAVPEPIKVLRIGPENPVLDAAFATPAVAAVASVENRPATEADRDFAATNESDPFDVIIFDRCLPASPPPANTWIIGAIPPKLESQARDAVGPNILTWNSSHPMLRYLQLDDVSIYKTKAIDAGDGAAPLIETDQGAILVSLPRGIYSDTVLTVPLIDAEGAWQSDWPLKPSFPLFVMNVLRTLGRVEADRSIRSRTGEQITVRPPAKVESVTVTLPDGQGRQLPANQSGGFDWLDTDRVGLYRFQAGDWSRFVAVNLFDDRESSLAPPEKIEVGEESTAPATEIPNRRELWRWLAAIGLVMVLAEWYIYNKRVYI